MSYTIKILNCIPGECRSCYERKIRSRGVPEYNIDAILRTIDRLIESEKERTTKDSEKSQPPCVHGGEPLIIPIDQLKRIFIKIFDYWGRNSIQTNGLLMTDEHIDLFQQYNVHVGISLDGDTAEMDRGRWYYKKHSESYMQQRIDQVFENMRRARVIAGSQLSCIVVLRKFNASKKMLPKLIKFIDRLYNDIGIAAGRTNPAIVYDPKLIDEEQLTNNELANALCVIGDHIFSNPKLTWQPFHDIVDLLFGYLGNASCSFKKCDTFCTSGEMAINHIGHWTNCLHGGTAVEGLQVLRGEFISHERYDLLAQLPQKYNGCKNCRFWHMCYGGCPGAGVQNDWRNRTRFCEGWKIFFKHVETKLKGLMPSLHTTPEFHPAIPNPAMTQHAFRLARGSTWTQQVRHRIENIIKRAEKGQVEPGGHADQPHIDEHGDHLDYGKTGRFYVEKERR